MYDDGIVGRMCNSRGKLEANSVTETDEKKKQTSRSNVVTKYPCKLLFNWYPLWTNRGIHKCHQLIPLTADND
jgi:hypothetical protein